MIIYPAIDIRNGKCVRLFQGDPDKETIYADDPLSMAGQWISRGAQWLHIVDLDGAFCGRPVNHKIIASITRNFEVNVQVGGGIRTEEDVVSYLSMGVKRVILGTRAFEDLEWFRELCNKYPGRIALGLDARDGFVAVRGWKETTTLSVSHVVESLKNISLAAIIYTDISRDGTHRGVNVEATERLLGMTSHPVIASGGVSSIDDILRLVPLAGRGLDGVIIGRALYDGNFTLEEALKIAVGKGGRK